MSPEGLRDLAAARSAWKSLVAINLGAPRSTSPAWSATPLPTLSNIGALSGAAAFLGLDAHRLLHNDSAPTTLEASDGNWGAAQAALGPRRSPRHLPASRPLLIST